MNRYAIGFRRVVYIGILINLSFALPGAFIPNSVFGMLGIEPVRDPVWAANASFLLFMLSLFYLPAAINPFRNRAAAILTVIARVLGAVFFLILWRSDGPSLFGWIDATLAVIQGVLLFLAFREGPDGE